MSTASLSITIAYYSAVFRVFLFTGKREIEKYKDEPSSPKKKKSKVRKRKRTNEHNIKESDSAKLKSAGNAQMCSKNRENAMSNGQSARKCALKSIA